MGGRGEVGKGPIKSPDLAAVHAHFPFLALLTYLVLMLLPELM